MPMQAHQGFEYCSLHYFNQWVAHDKFYYDALSSTCRRDKLLAVQKAAAFYGIARNLRKSFDVEQGLSRCEPVLNVIDRLSLSDFEPNLVEKINKVENEISNLYGGNKVLSLTTKFLWLKLRSPIIIYDSRVRRALGAQDGDLGDYYLKWQRCFARYQSQIMTTCSKLPECHLYVFDQSIGTIAYLQEIAMQDWFHKRVLDVYLWHKGKA